MAASRRAADTDDRIDEFALALFHMAGEESIRVIEALAAALANRGSGGGLSGEEPGTVPRQGTGLAEAAVGWAPADGPKWQACQRIARRAVRGSLADLTCGATAFHHIEASPEWCREHLPVAVHGPFLFYRI